MDEKVDDNKFGTKQLKISTFEPTNKIMWL